LTRGKRHDGDSACPSCREGGDERGDKAETRAGAEGDSVPKVRVCPLRSDLHPTDSARSDPKAARVPELWPAGDNDGTDGGMTVR
jgi:hypothetical protein